MKKFTLVIVLCILASTAYGLDWYGYLFDEFQVSKEEHIIGSVVDVFPAGQVWAVVAFTSAPVQGYLTASPVALLYAERPIVNDGDTIEGDFIYNGNWEV